MFRRAVVNAAADPDTLGGQMEEKLPVIPCAPERCARRSDRPKRSRINRLRRRRADARKIVVAASIALDTSPFNGGDARR
jgi:hypothetical protein